MSVMGLLFVSIAGVAAIWLWRQGVLQAPWLQEGEIAPYPGRVMPPPPAAKVGLGVFLVVAACVFSLMTAAYFMRQESPDWRTPPMPGVLLLNTLTLVASSVTIQMAHFAALQGARERLEAWLIASAALSLLFLLGQLWAWREFIAAGVYASGNPANAFFYLLTGAHGLHLIGGLVALAGVIGKAWSERAPETLERFPIERNRSIDQNSLEKKKARAPSDPVGSDGALATSVELCATYWHFLLLVWLLLFLMLSGQADALGVICRRIIS